MPFDWHWRGKRKYHYKPLNGAWHIARILVVKAATSSEEPLQCKLTRVSLYWLERNDYETISYAWGDQVKAAEITVNGRILRIPGSSEEVLRRMRCSISDRVLWIDSVCINQSDLLERGQQVGNMHFIYSHGLRNLVWLGQDDETFAEAANAVQVLSREFSQEISDLRSFHEVMRNSGGNKTYSDTNFTTTCSQDALFALYCRPWFKRLWVVQEVALARSNICCFGPFEIDLIDVLRAAQWLEFKKIFMPWSDTSSYQWSAVRSANLLAAYVDPLHDWTFWTSCSLLDVLDCAKSFETTDAKDQIFGLLGLYQQKNPGALSPLLLPNYQKSTATVFTDATRFVISESCNLELLGFVEPHTDKHEDITDLPSWVPAFHRQFNSDYGATALADFFDAGAGRNTIYRHGDSVDRHIGLLGLYVDKCTGCQIRSLSSGCRAVDHLDLAFREISSMLKVEHENSRLSASRADLAMTLIGEQTWNRQKAGTQDLLDFNAFLEHVMKYSELPPYKSPSLDGATRYLMAYSEAIINRRFFITASGRVGLGPLTMNVNDIVVVLYGGKFPFILRPKGNTHELVGHCYLHGVMYGEAVQKHKTDGGEDVMFCLI